MMNIAWGLIIITIMCFISVFTAIIPALVLRLFGLRRVADALVFWTASVISNTGLWLAGMRCHVSGDVEDIRRRVREGQKLCFVSNHTSMLDILLFFGRVKGHTGFVAKKEILYAPLFNLMTIMSHSVFIDRKNLHKSVKAIKKATRNIETGHPMVIFPEGTRSKTGEIGTFKHGSFRMATESGALVVPITIKGVRALFEDRKHIFQRGDCYLDVGAPVEMPKANDRNAVAAKVAEIEEGIKETYAGLGKTN